MPVSVCLRRDGRLEPLRLRVREVPAPPRLPGNVQIIDPAVRQRLASETANYLRAVERHFNVRVKRIAIDAPSAPRPIGVSLRAAEAALGLAGISYIQTPDVTSFDAMPARVREHLHEGGTEAKIPCANQLWMLFGFELFRTLSVAGWPCIEVYPQAIVRAIGVGEQHKSTAGAVLEQLKAVALHTGWPSQPSTNELRWVGYGSLDDRLDAYLSAWVASLPVDQCEALGNPPDDVIWRPKIS